MTSFKDLALSAHKEHKKAIIYSNFHHSGLTPYAAALAREGIPHAVFHGGLTDAERKKLVDDFAKGDIRVALVAPAGAEGISLKGAQLLQVLDGYWNDARTRQAVGRGIRFDSHKDLPPELQKITVQKFVSKLPLGVRDRLLESVGLDRSSKRLAVDDYMMNLADRKERLNHQLHELLKEVGTKKSSAEIDRDVEDLACVLSGDEFVKPVVALGHPARLRRRDQVLEGALRRERGEPVVGGFHLALGPLDEQPFFGAGPIGVSGAHPHPGEARGQRTRHALRQVRLRKLLGGSLWASPSTETG